MSGLSNTIPQSYGICTGCKDIVEINALTRALVRPMYGGAPHKPAADRVIGAFCGSCVNAPKKKKRGKK